MKTANASHENVFTSPVTQKTLLIQTVVWVIESIAMCIKSSQELQCRGATLVQLSHYSSRQLSCLIVARVTRWLTWFPQGSPVSSHRWLYIVPRYKCGGYTWGGGSFLLASLLYSMFLIWCWKHRTHIHVQELIVSLLCEIWVDGKLLMNVMRRINWGWIWKVTLFLNLLCVTDLWLIMRRSFKELFFFYFGWHLNKSWLKALIQGEPVYLCLCLSFMAFHVVSVYHHRINSPEMRAVLYTRITELAGVDCYCSFELILDSRLLVDLLTRQLSVSSREGLLNVNKIRKHI